MTLLNQRDPRWANIPLGFTKNTTIGSHGCTITCIAMLANLSPIEVNDRLKSVKGFANGNLVIWAKISEAIPWLQFIKRVYDYSTSAHNAEVKANLPCLVEVDFDGTPKTDNRHWVLFIGNQQMNDPWVGKTRSTGTYKPLLGYSIIKKKIVETQSIIDPTEPAPATVPTPAPEAVSEDVSSSPEDVAPEPVDTSSSGNPVDVPAEIPVGTPDPVGTDPVIVNDLPSNPVSIPNPPSPQESPQTPTLLDILIAWIKSLFKKSSDVKEVG